MLKLKKALLIVDVQNDFCPGGALSVPQGDKIIAVVNKYVRVFARKKLPIFFSRDWHLPTASHFKQHGGLWPVHCVQNTEGAQFHPELKIPNEAIIISKGMEPEKDSYSAFQAADKNGTEFYMLLKMFGVNTLFVGGLATDYCVRTSVRDALKNGFKVKLLMDATLGVNMRPTDSREAVEQMHKEGAKKITFDKLNI